MPEFEPDFWKYRPMPEGELALRKKLHSDEWWTLDQYRQMKKQLKWTEEANKTLYAAKARRERKLAQLAPLTLDPMPVFPPRGALPFEGHIPLNPKRGILESYFDRDTLASAGDVLNLEFLKKLFGG